MNKTIEKIESYKTQKIEQAIAKAEAELNDVRASYRDTGYDRYYNKMTKLEAEIEELEAYRDRDRAINDALLEKERVRAELENIKKVLTTKIFYVIAALPDCSEARSLKAFVDNL